MDNLVWHNERRKVDALLPYKENPRKMTQEQAERLRTSLERFNLVEVPAINTDNTIVAGHMRLRTMQLLGRGDEEIDVRVPNRALTEAELREYNLRSNQNTGEWDWDLLVNFDKDLLVEVGFDKLLLAREFDLRMPITEDEAPELPKEAKSKLGDLYKLGEHRVLCGDATLRADYDKLMGGAMADMVFTDPPYNVDYSGGMHADGSQSKRRKILNDKMSAEKFYGFLLEVCKNMLHYTKGAFYVCMSSSELHNLWRAFTEAGGHWQTYIIWAKNTFTLSRSDYQHQYEPIMHGLSQADAETAEAGDRGKYEHDAMPMLYGWSKHEWYGGRKQGDVWFFDKPSKSPDHPTQKPVGLCARAIFNSTKPGGIVLDPFGGSGSTLIAAQQAGRACYTMELDPRYVDVIVARWEQLTGLKAEKV
jgi:DNA modification methylase